MHARKISPLAACNVRSRITGRRHALLSFLAPSQRPDRHGARPPPELSDRARVRANSRWIRGGTGLGTSAARRYARTDCLSSRNPGRCLGRQYSEFRIRARLRGRAVTILAFKAYVALVAASLHGAVNPRRGGYAERRARILPHGRAPSTALFDPRQPCRKYL